MNERDFAYWLKGFFELTKTKRLNSKQVQMIKEHLNLVFNKVTPTDYEVPTEPIKITLPTTQPPLTWPSSPTTIQTPTIDLMPKITCASPSSHLNSNIAGFDPLIRTILSC